MVHTFNSLRQVLVVRLRLLPQETCMHGESTFAIHSYNIIEMITTDWVLVML